jgi:hypothetical protein
MIFEKVGGSSLIGESHDFPETGHQERIKLRVPPATN